METDYKKFLVFWILMMVHICYGAPTNAPVADRTSVTIDSTGAVVNTNNKISFPNTVSASYLEGSLGATNITGTLSNNITGNAATATVATNVVGGTISATTYTGSGTMTNTGSAGFGGGVVSASFKGPGTSGVNYGPTSDPVLIGVGYMQHVGGSSFDFFQGSSLVPIHMQLSNPNVTLKTNVVVVGSLTANSIIGDGSGLTGVASSSLATLAVGATNDDLGRKISETYATSASSGAPLDGTNEWTGTNTFTQPLVASELRIGTLTVMNDVALVGSITLATNAVNSTNFWGLLSNTNLPSINLSKLDCSGTNAVTTNAVALKVPVFTNDSVVYYMILFTNVP